MSLIFRPLMPPAALRSLTASFTPPSVEMPNVASLPVIDPYSPTTISPLSAAAPGCVPGVELVELLLSQPKAMRQSRARVTVDIFVRMDNLRVDLKRECSRAREWLQYCSRRR